MSTEERFARMERLLDRVVDTQLQLDGAFATLADSHIKTRQDLDRLIERDRQMDERIEKLVSGIGEFIRSQTNGGPAVKRRTPRKTK